MECTLHRRIQGGCSGKGVVHGIGGAIMYGIDQVDDGPVLIIKIL